MLARALRPFPLRSAAAAAHSVVLAARARAPSSLQADDRARWPALQDGPRRADLVVRPQILPLARRAVGEEPLVLGQHEHPNRVSQSPVERAPGLGVDERVEV